MKAAKNTRGATDAVAKCERNSRARPDILPITHLPQPAVDRSSSDKNRKLDEADEAGHIEKVGLDLRIKIQQGRMAKKMTQVNWH